MIYTIDSDPKPAEQEGNFFWHENFRDKGRRVTTLLATTTRFNDGETVKHFESYDAMYRYCKKRRIDAKQV